MKKEKSKVKELLELAEAFHTAINEGNKETIDKIVDDKLLFERSMTLAGKSHLKKFYSKNDLLTFEPNLPSSLRENEPVIFINQNRAKVIFERFDNCLLPKSKFNHAFLRQSYFMKKNGENWKLKALKDELLRFSRYDIKSSLQNLAERPANFLVNSIYKSNEH